MKRDETRFDQETVRFDDEQLEILDRRLTRLKKRLNDAKKKNFLGNNQKEVERLHQLVRTFERQVEQLEEKEIGTL